MDRDWYINECLRQLNDNKYYERQAKDLTNRIQDRIIEYTTRLFNEKLIDENTYKCLTSNPNPRAGRFYILPKISSSFYLKMTSVSKIKSFCA